MVGKRLPRDRLITRERRVDDELLARLDRGDEAELRAGDRAGAARVNALRVHRARHLHDRVLAKLRYEQAVALEVVGVRVAHAEDHLEVGRVAVGQAIYELERHALVAAGIDVGERALLALLASLRHVGGVALGIGALPQDSGVLGVGSRALVERALLAHEELPARFALHQVLHDLAVLVVVVQVLVGHHAKRADPVRSDFLRLFHLGKQVVVGEELREVVDAVHRHRAQPAQVVEAHVVEVHGLLVEVHEVHRAADHPDRCIANAHDLGEDAAHRLGDDASRVGEVHDPRFGRQIAHRLGEPHGLRDLSEGVRVASDAHGLLTENAAVERLAFVDHAPARARDAHRREHVIRAAHGVLERGRRGDRANRRRESKLVEDVLHGR